MFFINDIISFHHKGKKYNARIKSMKNLLLVANNIETNVTYSLRHNCEMTNFWFLEDNEHVYNVKVINRAIFHFDELPTYLKKEVIVNLEHYDLINLAKTCKKMYKLLSGKIDDDFRVLNGNVDSAVYDERCQILFNKKLLLFKHEEEIPWRCFYYRILKYKRQDIDHIYYSNIYEAIREGDVLKLKYFNFISPISNMINDYTDFIKTTISHGKLRVLKWFNSINITPNSDMIKTAVYYDQLDICKWFEEKNLLPTVMIQYRVKTLEMMIWLLSKGYILNENDCYYAGFSNNIALLKFLVEKKVHVPDNIFSKCIELGNINIVNYLYDNPDIFVLSDEDKMFYFKLAGIKGHLHLLKFFESKGLVMTRKILDLIITQSDDDDHINILEYYEKKNLLPNRRIVNDLNKNRSPRTIAWINERLGYYN